MGGEASAAELRLLVWGWDMSKGTLDDSKAGLSGPEGTSHHSSKLLALLMRNVKEKGHLSGVPRKLEARARRTKVSCHPGQQAGNAAALGRGPPHHSKAFRRRFST